jgi:hypothetical protein
MKKEGNRETSTPTLKTLQVILTAHAHMSYYIHHTHRCCMPAVRHNPKKCLETTIWVKHNGQTKDQQHRPHDQEYRDPTPHLEEPKWVHQNVAYKVARPLVFHRG